MYQRGDSMKKNRKRKPRPVVSMPPRKTLAPKLRIWSRFWKAFAALVSISCFIQLLFSVRPLVELSKSETLDPDNALTARFDVTSRGPLSISNVQAYCDTHEVALSNRHRFVGPITFKGEHVAFLDNGDHWAIPCAFGQLVHADEGTRLLYGDITVRVTYDYLHSLFHGTTYRRFKTEPNKEGVNIWLAVPSLKGYGSKGPIME
jgi:hypothetical protein